MGMVAFGISLMVLGTLLIGISVAAIIKHRKKA